MSLRVTICDAKPEVNCLEIKMAKSDLGSDDGVLLRKGNASCPAFRPYRTSWQKWRPADFKYALQCAMLNLQCCSRAVQNIQKLSEPPATAPMVVKLCMNDCKNREIVEKLVQPVTLHPSRFRHFKRGKRLKKT